MERGTRQESGNQRLLGPLPWKTQIMDSHDHSIKASIYNQALSQRFGIKLIEFLKSGEWARLDVAVAWVRRSGTRHLVPALREFASSGRKLRFIVGVDIENTSYEGLEDLLSLAAQGDCQTSIYHNELAPVFHPKMYLFANDKKARLIVGSNNITEAGLFTNTEVGLQIDTTATARIITDVKECLASWTNDKSGLARLLDAQLLVELAEAGYVVKERALRARRQESEKGRARRRGNRPQRLLFGSVVFTAPPPPVGVAGLEREAESPAERGGIGIGAELPVRGYSRPMTITNVLLMKVRCARGNTQGQIPIPLRESLFFQGQNTSRSAASGEDRRISPTRPERAHGKVNTYKFELPEAKSMSVPVVRMERTVNGLIHYVYDADSPQGRPIMDALEAGRISDPPTTFLTKPSDPNQCTWYTFI